MFGNCSNIEGILPDLVISSWLWSWEGTGQPPLELLVLQIPGIWCWMGSVRDTSPGLQREQVESTLWSDSHWLEGWGSLSHGTLGNHLGASHPSPPNCSATSRPAGAGRASVRAALTECQGRRSRPALRCPEPRWGLEVDGTPGMQRPKELPPVSDCLVGPGTRAALCQAQFQSEMGKMGIPKQDRTPSLGTRAHDREGPRAVLPSGKHPEICCNTALYCEGCRIP